MWNFLATSTFLPIFQTGAGKMASQSSTQDYMKQGQRTADAVMESAQDYSEALTGHISRNPLTAVLVALGVGWLIGLMSNWR